MNFKKYMTTTVFLIGILLFLLVGLNIFMNSLENIFSILVNGVIILLLIITIFSTLVTYMVVNDKRVNKYIMKFNFSIVSFLYPVLIVLGNTLNVPKNEIRKVYIKLNNNYIYSNRYKIKPEDILILIPHCIQKSECKLKITTNVRNCKSCGLCNVKDLIDLQDKYNVHVFIATGGTLARKKIKETRPKAVVAVACERDLTAGVQDIRQVPVLGVFNKRPNGPCVDTKIDASEVENAIKFFIGEC
ncbi:DUF116 domain-containing protein [Paraclostridium bifermentans]|jgi:hypothetical protein|uniref:DUF116 domain-containing protein n=1 Tax=Paraclostridium bifermentans ATCC 638 = DSM 14991 TaxID=1233171 RepID=T4VQR2_PARBF|nr:MULTISPECIES: DUF116 domain-containing protein [Paraclostridium]EQK43833.1 hypothetical protein C672_2777 [[Clostridium] bifermentans ATCC 638] [Paraclostridium bifermentans ATCC 638 = DSM 14991]KGJ50330.1 hypothetical protein KD33_05220 [Clostridium sp. NCR]MDU3335475.1 DUF116 domain-containing protein [Paraclostridium bifermentans]